MKLRSTVLGLLLALTVTARADDEQPAAPLENAKAELKALQKDAAAAKSGALDGSLKDGLPQMQSPIPGALPFDLPQAKTPQSELKKKRDAQKNWLLDGVSRLDEEAKLKSKAQGQSGRDKNQQDDEKADPTDSDYLLKLYSEQQKKDEANKGTRDMDRKKDALAQNDPLAPFLQGWLAGSPVRGRFFDEFLKKPAGQSGEQASTDGPALPAEVSPLTGLSITDPSGGRAPEPAKNSAPPSNPYLQALDLGEARGGPAQAPAANIFEPTARPAENKSSLAPLDLPPPARTGDRKPPPSPFANDIFFQPKKHF